MFSKYLLGGVLSLHSFWPPQCPFSLKRIYFQSSLQTTSFFPFLQHSLAWKHPLFYALYTIKSGLKIPHYLPQTTFLTHSDYTSSYLLSNLLLSSSPKLISIPGVHLVLSFSVIRTPTNYIVSHCYSCVYFLCHLILLCIIPIRCEILLCIIPIRCDSIYLNNSWTPRAQELCLIHVSKLHRSDRVPSTCLLNVNTHCQSV